MKSKQGQTLTLPTSDEEAVENLAAAISLQFKDPNTFATAALSLTEGHSLSKTPTQAERLFARLYRTAHTFSQHNAAVGFCMYVRDLEGANEGRKDLEKHQTTYEGVLTNVAKMLGAENEPKAQFANSFRRQITNLPS